MAWSPQQNDALTAVAEWLRRGDRQVFRLFGYAGTGKTTLARHIAEGIDGEIVFAAFTGKAASVLRQKGCAGATTLHSLIYRARGTDTDSPSFVLNRESAAATAELVIIDECSMVDEELGRDLLSFGTPVLVLGDPAQLPPVKGGGFFTEAEPDIMLTEVHRQAQDNPIIRLSMIVREGGRLDRGDYGAARVVPKGDIDAALVMRADQVLVGLNKTRRAYNQRIRNLLGYRDPMPAAGEKLVCLRNDKSRGLLNGGTWTIKAVRGEAKGCVKMDVVPEEAGHDGGRSAVSIAVPRVFFEGGEEELPFSKRREADEFTYGYALTVHKAQGSQWNEVVLFDESYAFREHRSRWLYTGITRAAERLTVVV
ncbi:AAA family ATPase [Chelatococcus sp. SYSU_G07232]|uniref:AAA family ATPase n=1 Tax=Chelatococcus albus TaxID=3047466 RepID=A0ABT7ADW3_9HYPH|nr:AAA family ATPase [Chelatococcus sp. SYSU_G07232]MDJ1157578.1 AAA family ATPase [Chelatococcus sp. SYSU_G07232]